ncbi:MAG: hypothetical protein FWH14_00370 [Oscillospiraceae bacterium]|nr:hypothetical protein [Oscillospiraceae bacterium]
MIQEYLTMIRLNRIEETKVRIEKEKTKQKWIRCLYKILHNSITIVQKCVALIIFLTIVQIISFVCVGVINSTSGNLENFEVSVENSQLPNLLTNWIQIALMIAQLIIPFFL